MKTQKLDPPEFDEVDEDTVDASSERDRLSESVVWATDWTTETIVAQLERGAIEMRPRFQRRDAWTIQRKSKFIESLVLGLPVPQIVLAERRQQRGTYIVLDGKQRLLSLFQFFGIAEGKHNKFALSGLEILGAALGGKRFADLRDEPACREFYHAFVNQPIRALVIRNWPDELFLHLVFLRLNTGSVKLSSQELRQALFPGKFSDFIDDAARDSAALRQVLQLDEPDFRMRDVEILLRYIAFRRHLPDYRGELKVFLDATSRRLNKDWKTVSVDLGKDVVQFELATQALLKVFGDQGVARRPSETGRRPFNRAIFDVQVFFFADPKVRAAAIRNPAAVRKAFVALWEKDDAFVRSVESTTKTIDATHRRYASWGEALKKALGLTFRVPRIEGNSIKI